MKRTGFKPPDPSKRLARRVPLARTTGLPRTAAVPAARVRVPLRAARDTGPSPKVREIVTDRDGRRCARCGRSVEGIRASVHHRKRKSQGGTNTPDNLLTLCGTGTTGCHGYVHANVKESLDAGWLVRGSEDPALFAVIIASEHGSGITAWLTPSGEYAFEPPGRAS